MDQNEKLHKLTVVLAHCQIKVSSLLKDQEKFLFARTWKNVFYIILEIFFYFIFILLFLSAGAIPSTPLKFNEFVGDKTSFEVIIHNDDTEHFVLLLKGLIIFCSTGFLFAALFSRKARKRGYLIKNSAEKIKSVSDELNQLNSL